MSADTSQTARAIAADPDAAQALTVYDTLDLPDGVKYGWVEVVAKSRYDALVKAFEDLDAKAAALVGYLGSGTGMISLGTLFTVVNSTVSPWTAIAVLPAIGLAFIALMCAAHARHTDTIFPPPTAETLLRIAGHFGDAEEKAKAAMAAQWDICAALMRPVIARKGEIVNNANFYFAWAVFALSLPLVVSVIRRFAGLTP